MGRQFYHSGDFGDIIYALPTIRALGGGSLLLGPDRQYKTRLNLSEKDVALIAPLLLAQPYLSSVRYCPEPPYLKDNSIINLNRFRNYLQQEREHFRTRPKMLSLAEAHLVSFGLSPQECQTKWLHLPSNSTLKSPPVLMHRSNRWNNPKFPWPKVVSKYRENAAFVGLPEEHENFSRAYGEIKYLPVQDFLELAQLIDSCKLFIGNQSLPYAIAEGLKKSALLEVWPEGPNCIFNRLNVIYIYDETIFLPEIDNDLVQGVNPSCPACNFYTPESTALFSGAADLRRCPKCHAVYPLKKPNFKHLAAIHQYNTREHFHLKLPLSVIEIYTSPLQRTNWLNKILAYKPPPAKLLDIGCSWGAFLFSARKFGYDVAGIDLCAEAVNFARSVLGLNVKLQETEDLEDNELLAVKLYDIITLFHVLALLPDPTEALAAAYRHLRPNGILFGITPNINSFGQKVLGLQWPWLLKDETYLHFNPKSLEHALRRAGFQKIEIYTHTGDYGLDNLIRLVQTKLPGQENVMEYIKEIENSGEGEEIVFYAKKDLSL